MVPPPTRARGGVARGIGTIFFSSKSRVISGSSCSPLACSLALVDTVKDIYARCSHALTPFPDRPIARSSFKRERPQLQLELFYAWYSYTYQVKVLLVYIMHTHVYVRVYMYLMVRVLPNSPNS